MIKKMVVFYVLVFTFTQIYCENSSLITNLRNYITVHNGFGIGLLATGVISFKNALNSFHAMNENNITAHEFLGSITLSENVKHSLAEPYQQASFNHKVNTYLCGSISLVSFGASIYCLKKNFY